MDGDSRSYSTGTPLYAKHIGSYFKEIVMSTISNDETITAMQIRTCNASDF